jgi:ankyrin repeat protein
VNTVKILFKCSSENCTKDNNLRTTPLIYAAWYGRVEVVRVLLEGGANVEGADAHRQTALHAAAFKGHLDVCRLLLDRGAKVDHLDIWKDTPLHWAAWKGHLSVVKLLVKRGADVSVKDGYGQTACDEARSTRRKDVADWLDLVSRG